MNVKKDRFQKVFPNLTQEMEQGKGGIKINSVRSNPDAGENAVSKSFANYTPDVIDFLRRCDEAEQAKEIIGYLERRREISGECARKLRKQLKENGIRSFGSKKENDYYLKQDGFSARKKRELRV